MKRSEFYPASLLSLQLHGFRQYRYVFALVSEHNLPFSLAKKMIWVLGAPRACLPNWRST